MHSFLLLLVFVCHAIASEDAGALVTEKVYLDLELEGEFAGRVVIGLFGSTSPKTVRNFVGLSNHEVSSFIIVASITIAHVEGIWI